MQSSQLPTIAVIVIAWFTLLALILYLLKLQNTLKECAPASRTITPGKVWLMLIPVFGLVWQFVLVLNIAKSLRNEFARLGIACSEAAPGQTLGLATCVCNCCIFIPLLGRLAGAIGFVLWIVYWIKIANLSRALGAQNAIVPASPIA